MTVCRDDVISVDGPEMSTAAPRCCYTPVGSWGHWWDSKTAPDLR